MIKFAVMTFMYNNWINSKNGSHEELIRILAESEADGMEAFCNIFMNNDELLKIYQKEIQNSSLKMPVMDLIANLACVDNKQREEVYDKMRAGIDICDSLDAEIIHVAGCSLAEDVTPEDGRKLIAEGLLEFVDDIEGRGMTLAIENFDPFPTLICSASDCIDLLDQTANRVKFVFDTGNFEAAGEHAEDNFDRMIDRTCHFHFKDYKKSDDPFYCDGEHFGHGKVKNREIAQATKRVGYSGWVALESLLQDENGPRETIAKELYTLKNMFK